jgi:hypothetical protein
VNDDGSFTTYNDIYGHDARMASALLGETVAYDPFPPMVEEAAAPVDRVQQGMVRQQRRGGYRGNSIADTLSGFLNN